MGSRTGTASNLLRNTAKALIHTEGVGCGRQWGLSEERPSGQRQGRLKDSDPTQDSARVAEMAGSQMASARNTTASCSKGSQF